MRARVRRRRGCAAWDTVRQSREVHTMGKEHEVSARFSSHGLRANGSRLKSPMALRLRFLGRPALFVSGLLVLALIFFAGGLAGSNGEEIGVYGWYEKLVKICGKKENGT